MTTRLRADVRRIMTGRGPQRFFSLATLLWAGSILYAGAARIRAASYSRGWRPRLRLPRPVISVGNLTTGGTGKTPLTMQLAQMIEALGHKPVIVSRGYKGCYDSAALVVGDGRSLLADARRAGDEPFLMASLLGTIPVVVGRDRYLAGRTAIARFEPDVLLLDDGFQHLKLHRDLNLLLLDAGQPFGNTYPLPRGSLREPPGALLRADAVVLTRAAGPPAYYEKLCHAVRPRPVFLAEHRPLVRGVVPAACICGGAMHAIRPLADGEALFSRNMVAFSGLARNDLFHGSIRARGIHLRQSLEFDDHHAYRPEDMHRIEAAAQRAGAGAVITTEKDFVRIPEDTRFSLPLIVMGVAVDITGGTTPWRDYIGGRIAELLKTDG